MEETSEATMERKTIVNHFEAGANCHVFNGPISGCVFAMPGANVTQQTGRQPESLSEKDEEVLNQLKPIFFGSEEEAKAFLVSIQGMKATQITDKVNRLVIEKKISDMSKHRDLWKVLHDCGIYERSESNWNMQVK